MSAKTSIFYWRPYRLAVIHLADACEWIGWNSAAERLMDYLYPDDLGITFPDASPNLTTRAN